MADVEQTQKMIPFITCEISLCQYVCELVFGVNVFDLDFGVQIDSIKQPINSNSVGSGNMSHCMVLILCRIVQSFCSPTHKIVPHISWHELPCHRTTKKKRRFSEHAIFQLLLQKFWIQTWFCNCQQYLCLFHTVFEYTPDIHDRRMMWVLPRSTSLFRTFHIGLIFCFLRANLMSSTYTDKNNPFWRCTIKHSQLETFSQPYSNSTFSNCPSRKKSCQRMTIQIPFERNDWVFHTGPWFWPFVSW